MSRLLPFGVVLVASSMLGGCGIGSKTINPFYEEPAGAALLGEANDHALNQDGKTEDTAREALESMATYRRGQDPQPVNPVMQPAVVRLMWVPDHLNKNGDLVPAHYYYLKVLKERWAVSDAFELEDQLGSKRDASQVPFVYSGTSR